MKVSANSGWSSKNGLADSVGWPPAIFAGAQDANQACMEAFAGATEAAVSSLRWTQAPSSPSSTTGRSPSTLTRVSAVDAERLAEQGNSQQCDEEILGRDDDEGCGAGKTC
jgi:hypothetical protein